MFTPNGFDFRRVPVDKINGNKLRKVLYLWQEHFRSIGQDTTESIVVSLVSDDPDGHRLLVIFILTATASLFFSSLSSLNLHPSLPPPPPHLSTWDLLGFLSSPSPVPNCFIALSRHEKAKQPMKVCPWPLFACFGRRGNLFSFLHLNLLTSSLFQSHPIPFNRFRFFASSSSSSTASCPAFNPFQSNQFKSQSLLPPLPPTSPSPCLRLTSPTMVF